MISLIIFLFVLGVLILVHEFGHFVVAKRIGVKVEKFSLGFGPALFSRERAGTLYSINAIPLGGYIKIAGDNPQEHKGRPEEYLSRKPKERAAIIFCGPLLNYILGFLFFWLVFFAGYPNLSNKVGGLLDGFPAKEAGILVGDRIVAIDGKEVKYWEELQREIHGRKDASAISLKLVRNGSEIELELKAKEESLDDQLGEKKRVGLIGITPFDEVIQVRHGLGESFILGAKKTFALTLLTYKALWRMVSGRISVRESMTGPLGIFLITSEAASLGIITLLHLVAVLSISLAIFNLLPIPILDGGHLFFILVEKLRGRPLSQKTEQIITRIGLAAIIFLMLVATYNDAARIFGPRIAKWLAK